MTNTLSIKTRAPAAILLMAVCLGVYGNTLPNAFVWDDLLSVAENRYIRDAGNIPHFFSPRYWNEAHAYRGQYRPVRMISYTVDYFFWGLNPAGYRVTNILLHAANVLLVFYLVILVAEKGGVGEAPAGRGSLDGLAFLAALFFAVHPIHTESVNLVKNRSDLLVLVFFLISLLLFIRHHSAAGRTRQWLMLAGAWFCFIPAVLSKEMALTLPGVVALYAVCFLSGAERRKALIRVIPFGLMILGYFWFMHAFIRPEGPLPPDVLLPSGAGQRALTVMKTTGVYFRMLLVPFPLILEHPFSIPESPLDPDILTLLFLLAPAAGIAVRSLSGNRVVLFAVGWIGLTLVPAANIVYVAARPIAEQRLYIPSLGFCLLLGYGVQSLVSFRSGRQNWTRAAVTGGILICLCAAVTVHRNRDWRDEITLYTRTLDENPGSPRIHSNLGNALCRANRYEEAIRHYQTALRLKPDYLDAHYNLGITFYELGRNEEAIRHYRKVLDLEPGNADALNNLGVALHETGRLDEAFGILSEALRIAPGDMQANWNMGDLLVDLGRSQEAIGYYLTVLRLRPDFPVINYKIGNILLKQGNPEQAAGFLLKALKEDPDYEQARQAYRECLKRMD